MFMTASTVFQSGAQSLVTSASIPKSSLARRIVHPCLPTSPVTMIASPGCARVPPTFTPSSICPIPVVVIKTPSTCPLPATLVSPDTICTPASAAVFSIAEAISSSFSIGKPSSMTNAQVRYSGFAPIHARSLTVPQMESLPIFPPGKNAGETINPSVETAIFPVGGVRTAASSAVRSGLAKCAAKIWSISSEVWRPPAPCAIVTVLSFKLLIGLSSFLLTLLYL